MYTGEAVSILKRSKATKYNLYLLKPQEYLSQSSFFSEVKNKKDKQNIVNILGLAN